MHHSLLAGLSLLFGMPAVVTLTVVPSDFIGSNHSFEPTTSTSVFLSVPTISTRFSTTSASVSVPSEVPVQVYGHFGPLRADQQLDCYLRARVNVIGDYELSYYFVSSLTASLPNGNYAQFLNRATRFDHLGDFDMPLFTVPSRYVPAGKSCNVYVNVKDETKTWSTAVSLLDEGAKTYQLPLSGGWFREKNSWTITSSGVSTVGVLYRDQGFRGNYDRPKNGLLPFSEMKLTLEASPTDLNLLSWGEGALRLKNYLSDFSTGTIEDDCRVWEMEMTQVASSFSPCLKGAYLYNPGDGKMRDGSAPRGLEFLTHSFYLPPCPKDEAGIKTYSFMLTFKNIGVTGQTTLEYPFTVTASALMASGCVEGSYCVEVGD